MNVICTEKEEKEFERHARERANGRQKTRSAWIRKTLTAAMRFEQATKQDTAQFLVDLTADLEQLKLGNATHDQLLDKFSHFLSRCRW